MTAERELLKKVIETYWVPGGSSVVLHEEIKELLAQPEPEPVAWIDDGSLKSLQESTGYALRFLTNDTESLKNTDVPLYLAPPTRNPLTRQQISVGNQSMLNVTREAFVKGVKYAEQQHGIGVDDELRGYVMPLYTAPPKREPFGPEERQRLSRAYSTQAEQVAFQDGIIFAEISYGIGGGE